MPQVPRPTAVGLIGRFKPKRVNANTLVNTTSSAIGATGSQVNTPASMANIIIGSILTIDTAGNAETIQVTAVTGTTFTAVYTRTHAGGVAIVGAAGATLALPVGQGVCTTGVANGAITGSTTAQAVTPDSMAGIVVGLTLWISGGTGTAEAVRVLSITATTFTAVVQNNHSGPYTIISTRPHWVGPVSINKVGTTDVITLYNGHPSLAGISGLPADVGTAFAVITPAAGAQPDFWCAAECGLFYSVGGTAGEYTLQFEDVAAIA